jgi:hypothetical protein
MSELSLGHTLFVWSSVGLLAFFGFGVGLVSLF